MLALLQPCSLLDPTEISGHTATMLALKHSPQMMTDMPYALYPQGLTLALHHLSELRLPVYITGARLGCRNLFICGRAQPAGCFPAMLPLHHAFAQQRCCCPSPETGVADRGDDLRAAMVEGYMAEVEAAVAKGYNLR